MKKTARLGSHVQNSFVLFGYVSTSSSMVQKDDFLYGCYPEGFCQTCPFASVFAVHYWLSISRCSGQETPCPEMRFLRQTATKENSAIPDGVLDNYPAIFSLDSASMDDAVVESITFQAFHRRRGDYNTRNERFYMGLAEYCTLGLHQKTDHCNSALAWMGP